MAVDGSGDVFIADTGNNRVVEVTARRDPDHRRLRARHPAGVAVDGSGDVFIADTGNNRVVEVTPNGAADHRRLRAQSSRAAWRWTARATSSSPTPATTGWWR